MKKQELINLLSSSTDKKYAITALVKLLENNRNHKNNELLWNIAEINCRCTGKSTRYADDIIQASAMILRLNLLGSMKHILDVGLSTDYSAPRPGRLLMLTKTEH